MGSARKKPSAQNAVRARIEEGVTPGTWTVTFGAEAVPGTLVAFAGALSVSRLDIISATVRVTDGGTVEDTFEVVPLKDGVMAADSGTRLADLAFVVLGGQKDLAADMRDIRALHPSKTVAAPVIETHTDSSFTTGIKVVAADRPGLLYDLASTLASRGLRTRSLIAVTFTGRAYDTFRVVDSAGAPPTDAALLAALREELEAASEG